MLVIPGVVFCRQEELMKSAGGEADVESGIGGKGVKLSASSRWGLFCFVSAGGTEVLFIVILDPSPATHLLG